MSTQEDQSHQPREQGAEGETPIQVIRVYPVYLYEEGLGTMADIVTGQVREILDSCPELPDPPENEESSISFEQASELDCLGIIREGRVIPLFEFKGLLTPRTREQKMLHAALGMQVFLQAFIDEFGRVLHELEELKAGNPRNDDDADGMACGK